MHAIEIAGEIDGEHRLLARVPDGFPAGPVRLIIFPPDLLPPEEDHAGSSWARGIAAEWDDDLRDSRQDIYTLQDGHPVNVRP